MRLRVLGRGSSGGLYFTLTEADAGRAHFNRHWKEARTPRAKRLACRAWGEAPMFAQAEGLFFLCGKTGNCAPFVERKEAAATAFDRLRGESVLYYGQAPEEIPKGTFSGQIEGI